MEVDSSDSAENDGHCYHTVIDAEQLFLWITTVLQSLDAEPRWTDLNAVWCI